MAINPQNIIVIFVVIFAIYIIVKYVFCSLDEDICSVGWKLFWAAVAGAIAYLLYEAFKGD